MQCPECGARIPGAESCLDRFHSLLGVEPERPELAHMHGLTVLTYHLQHPSRTKPWYQGIGAEVMRRVFERGEDWLGVLRQATRQRNVDRAKAAAGPVMPPAVITVPIAGELTITVIDPLPPAGQADQVLAWARSVAEHRFVPSRQDG